MALETGDYVGDLTITNPPSGDPKSQGDDHIRLLKKVARQSFPGFTGPILVGGTTAGAVNAYTLTPSTAMVAYVANTILVAKVHIANTAASVINVSALGNRDIKTVSGAALTSGDMPIDCYVAMVDTGAEYRIIGITKNYVDQLVFTAALPAQAGNSGKFLTTDATNASWANVTTLAAVSITGDQTYAENAGIVLDAALSADGKYSGVVEGGTAGAALAFGELVYFDVTTSSWLKAKADVILTSAHKLGAVVLAAAGAASATTVLLYGKIRADSLYPTFTIGAPVYLSAATAGLPTSTKPTGTTDFVVRVIGFANTGDELFFNPSPDYITLA